MKNLFSAAVDRVLAHEGGYVDDPDDRGGETNRGVTWPALREAKKLGIVPDETTIAGITRDQAIAIYRELYWRRCGCDQVPPGVAVMLFDFAINSGPPAAVKALQRSLRLTADGIVGPATIAAAQRTDARCLGLLGAARLEFLSDLIARRPPQIKFRRGWFARVVETAVFAGQVGERSRA